MFPGLGTKLSESVVACATTITPQGGYDIIRVTDTTATTVITTITPGFSGFSGISIVLNQSGGNITTLTTGNVQTAVTIGQNVAVVFIYSASAGKWVPGALA